jgi:hypothetical protein
MSATPDKPDTPHEPDTQHKADTPHGPDTLHRSDMPRRPFQDAPAAVPFHRSPEFQRLIWLVSLLVFVGLFVVYLLRSAEQAALSSKAAEEVEQNRPATPTPAEIEARRTKLATLFEGSLADSQNGDGFGESPGYCRLLQLLTSYTAEEVSQRATRRLDYASVLSHPDAWRGEFVTVRGLLAGMYAVKLKSKVFGIGDVFRGYLTDADGKNGLVFDLPYAPPQFEMRRSPLDVEGILYRTARYENEKGEMREVPYLLARSLRVVENPRVGATGFLQDHGGTLLVLMGLAIFTTRLLMYVFQRRARHRPPARPERHAGFHEMFESRLREDRRAPGPRPPA